MESVNPNSVVELQNVDEVVELPANQTEDQEQADDQSNVNFLYTPSEMLQKRQRLWSEFSYKLKSIQADQIDVAKFVKFASDDDCPDDARRQHRLENLHRFFRCIVRGSDCIDKAELQHRVLQLTEDDIEDKCCIVFDMFDADNDGLLSRLELSEAVSATLQQCNPYADDDEVVAQLVDVLSDDANGAQPDIGITKRHFVSRVTQCVPVVDSEWSEWPLNWLLRVSSNRLNREEDAVNELRLARRRHLQTVKERIQHWFQSVSATSFWALLLGLICTALFLEAFYRYSDRNIFFRLAKGFGHNLNFCAVALILLMTRNMLTRLRYSVLGNILPVDSATKFHQIIGILTVVFSLAHTMLHLLNFINYGELAWWCYFVTAPKGYGVAGTQGITGVILLTILLTIAAASLPCVRRSGHFEVFYYTHKLIWPWVVALLIHSKVFWKWAIVPLILYCSEVAYRLLIARKKALLLAAEPLPDKMVKLVALRPSRLRFHAGQFFYIRLPLVSACEWHPFSASSAPEDDRLTFHIRTCGDWTRRLHDLALRIQRCTIKISGGLGHIDLDGPYGSPHANVFNSRFALLIAGGIGVAPFTSILASLLHRHRDGVRRTPQSVHFVWLNHNSTSISWFRELLHELEQEVKDKDFLHLHIFITAADKHCANTLLLGAARSKATPDVLTGLQTTRTGLGSPSWFRLLSSIYVQFRQLDATQKVEAFYCGPAGLERLIRSYCQLFRFRTPN